MEALELLRRNTEEARQLLQLAESLQSMLHTRNAALDAEELTFAAGARPASHIHRSSAASREMNDQLLSNSGSPAPDKPRPIDAGTNVEMPPSTVEAETQVEVVGKLDAETNTAVGTTGKLDAETNTAVIPTEAEAIAAASDSKESNTGLPPTASISRNTDLLLVSNA